MKKQKKFGAAPETAAVVLTREKLAEMHAYAVSCPYDLSHLGYREVQQVLTVYSLIKLLESFGLETAVGLAPEVKGRTDV